MIPNSYHHHNAPRATSRSDDERLDALDAELLKLSNVAIGASLRAIRYLDDHDALPSTDLALHKLLDVKRSSYKTHREAIEQAIEIQQAKRQLVTSARRVENDNSPRIVENDNSSQIVAQQGAEPIPADAVYARRVSKKPEALFKKPAERKSTSQNPARARAMPIFDAARQRRGVTFDATLDLHGNIAWNARLATIVGICKTDTTLFAFFDRLIVRSLERGITRLADALPRYADLEKLVKTDLALRTRRSIGAQAIREQRKPASAPLTPAGSGATSSRATPAAESASNAERARAELSTLRDSLRSRFAVG